jgi:glycosyltransferase involved in cell wall biosynthesis
MSLAEAGTLTVLGGGHRLAHRRGLAVEKGKRRQIGSPNQNPSSSQGSAGRRPRVAFVVQRYGDEVGGGAEYHCQRVAERMARVWDVTVLTTTAAEYTTWANHYPPGETTHRGVKLIRFPVRSERDPAAFDALSPRVLDGPHSDADEQRWLEMQGPDCPDLLEQLRAKKGDYDFFVFFTYLYSTTAFGLPIVADKAWLVPTAHDEKPIRLRWFDRIFGSARRILFNTEAEQRFCRGRFDLKEDRCRVVGCGVDGATPAERERVRSKYDLPDRYLLYLGRVDPAKGVGELLEFYAYARERLDDLPPLVLAGRETMDIPRTANVLSLGFVENDEKSRILADAELLVAPSRFESLSLVLLESWLAGTAVLVNGHCEVLKEQVVMAGGGLYYESPAQFIEAFRWLLVNPEKREAMAESGGRFVQRRYSWDRIEDQYIRIASECGVSTPGHPSVAAGGVS